MNVSIHQCSANSIFEMQTAVDAEIRRDNILTGFTYLCTAAAIASFICANASLFGPLAGLSGLFWLIRDIKRKHGIEALYDPLHRWNIGNRIYKINGTKPNYFGFVGLQIVRQMNAEELTALRQRLYG